MNDIEAVIGSELLKAALEAGAILKDDKQVGFMRLESRTASNTIVAESLFELYRGLAYGGGWQWGNV